MISSLEIRSPLTFKSGCLRGDSGGVRLLRVLRLNLQKTHMMTSMIGEGS